MGLIPDIAQMARMGLSRDGDVLILFGAEAGHLGQSLYQELMLGATRGAPPPVDLAAERRTGDLVRRLIRQGRVSAVHDVSDGGLMVAAAEMALAGGRGVGLDPAPEGLPAHAVWFGEDQGRYVVALAPGEVAPALAEAGKAQVPARILGTVSGQALKLPGEAPLSLHALRVVHERWLPELMAAKIG